MSVDPITCVTSDSRVFAAGDVAPGPRTVTEAVAQGKRAAWGIDKAQRGAPADRRPPPPPLTGQAWPKTTPPSLPTLRADQQVTLHPAILPVEQRIGQAEVVGCFTEQQARTEAARCMLCGSCSSCRACLDTYGCPAFFVEQGLIKIDSKLCTGCGACAAICPNGAIVPITGAHA